TFCCFNKSQKLEPTSFAVWMRLLQQVPQSRLWLLSDHAVVEANLRAEAQRQGVDPARLVFAPRVSKQAHLERHAHADLFLDTRYYNAHVTASDALWAGTPVVTVLGQTFASRVGASLLTAAGLPELIAPDLATYEQLALHLATHPSELQALKQRLQTRDSALFNKAQTVRHLEAGYRAIWQRWQAGLPVQEVWVERQADNGPRVQPHLPQQPSPEIAAAPPIPVSDTAITCRADAGFLNWISQAQGSLVVTTYQANRLLLVGWNGQQVTLLAREFVKPMGVAVAGNQLALSTQQAIRLFANAQPLALDYLPHQPGRYDGLYLPRATYHTGDLYSHDLGFGEDGLWLVNTRFSCLASLSPEFSFVPRWYPPFISALTPEDRCHLNGLALVEGKPKYVTALGESDRAGGWREQQAGGIVIEVETDEIVLRGLSMPHSPRWHQGRLWLLNSAEGELWRVNPATWEREVVCTLPGFGRGLALVGDFALVGLCQGREARFANLPVQSRFGQLICGVALVDLRRGVTVGLLEFPTGCRELYDVQFLPNLLRPNLVDLDQPAAQEAFTAPTFAYWLRSQPDPSA
ncbi:MAG: TIGR03032 family protein, partial [Elainella sp.]